MKEQDTFFYINEERFLKLIKSEMSITDNFHFLRNEMAKFYLTDEFNKLSKEQFLSYRALLTEINDIYMLLVVDGQEYLKTKDFPKNSILYFIFKAKELMEQDDEIHDIWNPKVKISELEKRHAILAVRRRRFARFKFLINSKMIKEEKELFKYLKNNYDVLNEKTDLIQYLKNENKLESIYDTIYLIIKENLKNIYVSINYNEKLSLYMNKGVYKLSYKYENIERSLKSSIASRFFKETDTSELLKPFYLFNIIYQEYQKSEYFKYPILNENEMDDLNIKFDVIKERVNIKEEQKLCYEHFSNKMKSVTKKQQVIF